MFLRLGPRVRRYLAVFFRVYSTWHFLTAYPAKHVTLGAEKSLVRKLCNGIYVINSPNMQCLQILGNKTFLLSVETGTEAGTSGWHPYARWVGDRARPTERLTLTGHSPAPNRLCPTRALPQSLRHCVCKLPSGVTFRFIDLFR